MPPNPPLDLKEWLTRAYAEPQSTFPPVVPSFGYTLPPIINSVWHAAVPELSHPAFKVLHWGQNTNNWIVAPADGSSRGRLNVVFIANATNNIIVLGPNTDLHGQVFFHGSGGLVLIGGDMGQRSEITARLWSTDNLLLWGHKTTSNSVNITIEGDDAYVVIGDDCMLARDVDIRTSDEHALVDLKDGRMLNAPSSVHVEPHVWLGDKSTLLKGVHVGYGAVIGGGSVVTRAVPRFTISAGVPARIIRSGASWSRFHTPENGLVETLRLGEAGLTGPAPRAGVKMVPPVRARVQATDEAARAFPDLDIFVPDVTSLKSVMSGGS